MEPFLRCLGWEIAEITDIIGAATRSTFAATPDNLNARPMRHYVSQDMPRSGNIAALSACRETARAWRGRAAPVPQRRLVTLCCKRWREAICVGLDGDGTWLEFGGPHAAAAWRRAADEALVPPTFAVIGPETGFSARYAELRAGEARIVEVRSAPLRLLDADGATAPMILVQAVVEGRPVIEAAFGEPVSLRAGDVLVRRRDPDFCLRAERVARIVSVVMPEHVLTPRHARAEVLETPVGPAADGLAARVLHQLVAGLAEHPPTAAATGRAIEAVAALAGLLLALTAPRAADVSQIAAARAEAILAYLERNFANPGLSPQSLADDLSISVRYAHKLMQMTGRSFRETLVALRLEAARAIFAANTAPRQTISDIAISVGFNDLSQFNRHFRARYGMTPRAARRLDEASRDGGNAL